MIFTSHEHLALFCARTVTALLFAGWCKARVNSAVETFSFRKQIHTFCSAVCHMGPFEVKQYAKVVVIPLPQQIFAERHQSLSK